MSGSFGNRANLPAIKLTTPDLYWLAGLLEGEASFGMRRNKTAGKVYYDPIIQLGMTDKDVMERAASIFGTWLRGFEDKRPNHKTIWATSVVSSRAAGWMMTLYPLMGSRRQQRIAHVLAEWRAIGPRGKARVALREAVRNSPLSSRRAAKEFGFSQTHVRRIRSQK